MGLSVSGVGRRSRAGWVLGKCNGPKGLVRRGLSPAVDALTEFIPEEIYYFWGYFGVMWEETREWANEQARDERPGALHSVEAASGGSPSQRVPFERCYLRILKLYSTTN